MLLLLPEKQHHGTVAEALDLTMSQSGLMISRSIRMRKSACFLCYATTMSAASNPKNEVPFTESWVSHSGDWATRAGNLRELGYVYLANTHLWNTPEHWRIETRQQCDCWHSPPRLERYSTSFWSIGRQNMSIIYPSNLPIMVQRCSSTPARIV